MPVLSAPFRAAILAFGLAASSAMPVAAQSPEGLSLELNNATDVQGACRLTFAASNTTGTALSALSYEIVLYDPNGIVPEDGFLLFEFGAMPEAKTKVVQFLLENRRCNQISRILVNDAAQCSGDQGDLDFCLSALNVSSRNAIEFGL